MLGEYGTEFGELLDIPSELEGNVLPFSESAPIVEAGALVADRLSKRFGEGLWCDLLRVVCHSVLGRVIMHSEWPSGPVLAITNHPFAADIGQVAVLALANGASSSAVIVGGFATGGHAGQMLKHFDALAPKDDTGKSLISSIEFKYNDPAQNVAQFAVIQERLKAGVVVMSRDGRSALHDGQQMEQVSSLILRALKWGGAVVPMRFCGGLPVGPHRMVVLPYDFNPVDLIVGEPIRLDDIVDFEPAERQDFILERVNALSLDQFDLPPLPRSATMRAAIAARQLETGASAPKCFLIEHFYRLANPSLETQRLLSILSDMPYGIPEEFEEPRRQDFLMWLTDGLNLILDEKRIY